MGLRVFYNGLRLAPVQREQLVQLFDQKRFGQDFLMFGEGRFDRLHIQLDQLFGAFESFGEKAKYRFETGLLRSNQLLFGVKIAHH
jgi:hypothetical protein